MEAIHQILCLIMFLAWQVFSALEGVSNGNFIYAKHKSQDPDLKKKDFHKFWTTQRLVAGIGLPFVYMAGEFIGMTNIWVILFNLILLAISMILVFSFWHNGELYVTVNKWMKKEHYVGGFRADRDGRAKFDFTFKQRSIMYGIGIALYIFFMWTHLVRIMEYWQYRNISFVVIGTIVLGSLIYFKVYTKPKDAVRS